MSIRVCNNYTVQCRLPSCFSRSPRATTAPPRRTLPPPPLTSQSPCHRGRAARRLATTSAPAGGRVAKLRAGAASGSRRRGRGRWTRRRGDLSAAARGTGTGAGVRRSRGWPRRDSAPTTSDTRSPRVSSLCRLVHSSRCPTQYLRRHLITERVYNYDKNVSTYGRQCKSVQNVSNVS